MDVPEWIGSYQVVRRRGSGSMGDVYQCHDAALGREVAVKVLKPQYAVDEHYRRRFRREARAVASLSHPCVVQVYGIHEGESGSRDGTFIVMEFVDGRSADDFLAENGHVEIDVAARWIRDAASGLREAAAKGIIHRDVKPSNILVTPTGGAKIVDFGLAKELGSENALTQEGIVLGTPHYISPEQGRGRPLDHRADIYSLGATFYHILTGRPPFDGDSQISVIVAHVNEAPVAPHLERPEIPESVTRVVLRMMAKSPEDRYADYDELLEDLDALLETRTPPHATGAANEVAPRAPSRRPRPRLRVVAPLVVALLVGGIALAPALQRNGTYPDPGALRDQLGPWCAVQEGHNVELDLDFTHKPKGRSSLKLLESVLTLPPEIPPGAKRPDLLVDARRGTETLSWSGFDMPFAFGFSFERLDSVELRFGDAQIDGTNGDLHMAFSLVAPHGSQNRQLIFRLALRQEMEPSLLIRALERHREVEPTEVRLVRLTTSADGSPTELRMSKTPVLGTGALRLELRLETRATFTGIVVTMEKLPADGGPSRTYRLSAKVPGKDWARGVPTLMTESTQEFSVSLDEAVFRGKLDDEFTVTEVAWRG